MARTKNSNGSSAATVGFEQKLWAAADALRNNMDAAEYKHVDLTDENPAKIVDTYHAWRSKDRHSRERGNSDPVGWAERSEAQHKRTADVGVPDVTPTYQDVPKDFHAIVCVKPPRYLVRAYEARVSLLPMLTSGEVRVKEEENIIEEVTP